MVFKPVEGAQKTWRRLDGQNQLPKTAEVAKRFNLPYDQVYRPPSAYYIFSNLW